MLSKFLARVKSSTLAALACMVAVGLSAVEALADPPAPPDLPAITFPISPSSIVTSIVTAGATILVLVFGVVVGFTLIRKLMRRLKGSV